MVPSPYQSSIQIHLRQREKQSVRRQRDCEKGRETAEMVRKAEGEERRREEKYRDRNAEKEPIPPGGGSTD